MCAPPPVSRVKMIPPCTATGIVLHGNPMLAQTAGEGIPSWPASPRPQQYAAPLAVNAHVCAPPVDTATNEKIETEMAALPDFPSAVAVIVACPCAMPRTNPVASTVTIAFCELAQLIVRPVRTVPAPSYSVAVSRCVAPVTSAEALGDTVTDATDSGSVVVGPSSPEHAATKAKGSTKQRHGAIAYGAERDLTMWSSENAVLDIASWSHRVLPKQCGLLPRCASDRLVFGARVVERGNTIRYAPIHRRVHFERNRGETVRPPVAGTISCTWTSHSISGMVRRRRSLTCIVVLWLVPPASLAAQSSAWEPLALVARTTASVRFDPQGSSNRDRVSIAPTVGAMRRLSRGMVRIELSLVQKGFERTQPTYRFTYLELPLLLEFRGSSERQAVLPVVQLGLAPSVALRCSVTYTGVNGPYRGNCRETDPLGFITPASMTDLGLVIGAGLRIRAGRQRVLLEVRATRGLTSYENQSRHRVFSAGVGLAFPQER